LLKKPSPFHPGEAILNGAFWQTLGNVGFPAEIWARASGILWGGLTVAQSLRLSRKDPQRLGLLPWLVFFNAALLSYATEMRPYASLFYSGALCAAVIWEGGLEGKLARVGAWLLILFGHLYGICFLAGCLLWTGRGRRFWPEILGGAAAVGGTLASISIVKDQGIAPWDGFFEISRQILGTWSNPHKTALVFAPLAAWGAWRGWRDRALRTRAVLMVLFILGAAVLPVAATVYGKYFFVPRQTAAGTVAFLLLCSWGISELRPRIPRIDAVAVALVALSWVAVSLLKIPPFPSQPFHRFNAVARELAASDVTDAVFLDVCNWGPFEDYLNRYLHKAPDQTPPRLDGNVTFEQKCWARSPSSSLCIMVLTDSNYCTKPASMLGVEWALGRAVRSRQFQKIIHGYQDDPAEYAPEFKGRYLRDW
jgi:hypothetical protein